MTFVAPGRPAGNPNGIIRPLVAPHAAPALRDAREDGARRALGTDGATPAGRLHGTALEHLARIAFG